MSKLLKVATRSPEDKSLALSSDDRGFIQTSDYSSDLIIGRFVEPMPVSDGDEQYIGSRGVFGVRALSYYPSGDAKWVDNRTGMCVNRSIVYVISEGKVKSFTANLKPLKTYDLEDMHPLSEYSALIPNEVTGETLVVDDLGKAAVINGSGVLYSGVVSTGISKSDATNSYVSSVSAHKGGWVYANNHKIYTLSSKLDAVEIIDLKGGAGLTGSNLVDLIVDEEVDRKAQHIEIHNNHLYVFCSSQLTTQSNSEPDDAFISINLTQMTLNGVVIQGINSPYGFQRTIGSAVVDGYIYYGVFSLISEGGVYKMSVSGNTPPTQVYERLRLKTIRHSSSTFELLSGDPALSHPMKLTKHGADFELDWDLTGFFRGGDKSRAIPMTVSKYGDIYVSAADGIYRLALDLQLKGYTFNG